MPRATLIHLHLVIIGTYQGIFSSSIECTYLYFSVSTIILLIITTLLFAIRGVPRAIVHCRLLANRMYTHVKLFVLWYLRNFLDLSTIVKL